MFRAAHPLPGLVAAMGAAVAGCPGSGDPGPAGPAASGAPAGQAPTGPDPELPDRQALFRAAWDVADYERPVSEVYLALELGFTWVGRDALTQAGALLLAAVSDVARHGLHPRALDGRAPRGRDGLVDAARGWSGGGAQARAALELRLAVAYAHLLDHAGALLTLEEEARIPLPKTRWRERAVRYVERVLAVRAGADPAAGLWPRTADYVALQSALIRYRAMGDLGPAPAVNRRRRRWLERGMRGPPVAVLVRRLEAEGFLAPGTASRPADEPADAVYDAAVEDAVSAYQRAHGIDPDGVVGPAVLAWLERPAADKVLRLRAALRRVREAQRRLSGIVEDPGGAYVRVNVPAFRLTLVRGGKTALDMSIVVGEPGLEADPDRPEAPPTRRNATPLLQATITHLVWNPPWQVPDRIKAEELDPHLVDEPDWYAANGYRLERDPRTGVERAIQLPGPGNALGQLKFVFGNPYGVYLHDTPKRGLFARARRAASHGCMRLEDPIALARLLLEPAGQWDEGEVTRLLTQPARSEQFPDGVYEGRWVKLARPIPLLIDYQAVTARPDVPGGVVFHADLYELDRPYMDRLRREDARLTARAGP